jgi:transposase
LLGPAKARDLDRPILISLDAAVPKDHFYRHLHRLLDLSFVRDLAADCYASGGRPSIDPEVFFRLQLIMFFSGIRSERQLMEQVSYNLAMRWYAGYNLDEPLPDHSSLSKIRSRLGLPVFRRFFDAIAEQCAQAGLVWGKELVFDATNLPKGYPAPTPQSIRSSQPCVLSWKTISPHSQRRGRKNLQERRAGSYSRHAASILIARRPRSAVGRATSGGARLTQTPH